MFLIGPCKLISLLFLVVFNLGKYYAQSNEINLLGNYEISPTGIEIVYQRPNREIKGIVFLAHGCSHSATDWWPSDKNCPKCIGLPVERAIVTGVLLNNYIALSQSSINREDKCWTEEDNPRAIHSIQLIIKKFNLPENIPVHLLGASSGGNFVGHLALRAIEQGNLPIKIASTTIQIMPIRITQHLPKQRIPGLLFVHMSRDAFSAELIHQLISKHDTKYLQEMVINPLKIEANFFNRHAGHLSLEDSTVLYNALKSAGFIDAAGLLVEDPRVSQWRAVASKALPHIVPAQDNLISDQSGISELLNLAYAMHEITDENLDKVFEFMKSMEI